MGSATGSIIYLRTSGPGSKRMLGDHVECTTADLYLGLFSRTDVKLKAAVDVGALKRYLSEELFKSRVEPQALEAEFLTYAECSNLDFGFASNVWADLVAFGTENLFPRLNVPNFEQEFGDSLAALGRQKTYAEESIKLVRNFRAYFSARIRLNFPTGANSRELQLGGLGELLAYLIATDVEKHDCIYHKLVPDTANAARHGVDLLTIRFGPSPDEDEVHWWEAKGTANSFATQRDRIVYWFNAQIYLRLSTTVEAAKKEWLTKYDRKKWTRASMALSKYMLKVSRYRYVGSIAFDSSVIPSEEALKGFGNIKCSPKNRQLVLFPLTNIERLAEEVFAGAWST
jgi:hypothetical protein